MERGTREGEQERNSREGGGRGNEANIHSEGMELDPEDSEGAGKVPSGPDRRGADTRALPPDAAASIAAAEAAAIAQGTIPKLSAPTSNPEAAPRVDTTAVNGEGSSGGGAGQPWPGFDKFATVQSILDSNRMLIHEIKHNHETRDPDGLVRNVSLIRELNENVARVVELYGEISDTFVSAFGEVQCDS